MTLNHALNIWRRFEQWGVDVNKTFERPFEPTSQYSALELIPEGNLADGIWPRQERMPWNNILQNN